MRTTVHCVNVLHRPGPELSDGCLQKATADDKSINYDEYKGQHELAINSSSTAPAAAVRHLLIFSI